MNKKIKKISRTLKSLEDSSELALEILNSNKRIVCLTGNLGAGKTTLSGMIIRELLKDQNVVVKSPTFNIMQIYSNKIIDIHHYDLYRLKSLDEALGIGIEESLENAICIIEWPEIAMSLISPENLILVDILLENDVRIANLEYL